MGRAPPPPAPPPQSMDFYRFPMDLGGFLACGFALISLFFLQSISQIFQVNIVEACSANGVNRKDLFKIFWIGFGPKYGNDIRMTPFYGF